jgi:hypothetical protein
MAYNMKDVFYLDTSILTTTSTGDGVQNIDLSSYVDPIARGRAKGTGLAIYKVFFDFSNSSDNSPVPAASAGTARVGIISSPGLPSVAVGSGSITAGTLAAGNDLMIAGMDFYGGATAAGDPAPYMYLTPSKEVPYIVVRDQVSLMVDVSTAFTANTLISVRLECAQVTLDQSTLNQLLRTQTV